METVCSAKRLGECQVPVVRGWIRELFCKLKKSLHIFYSFSRKNSCNESTFALIGWKSVFGSGKHHMCLVGLKNFVFVSFHHLMSPSCRWPSCNFCQNSVLLLFLQFPRRKKFSSFRVWTRSNVFWIHCLLPKHSFYISFQCIVLEAHREERKRWTSKIHDWIFQDQSNSIWDRGKKKRSEWWKR